MSSSSLDARGLPPGTQVRPEYEVTPREAQAALAAGKAILIDVRTQEEWDFAHVPGSTLIPLDQISRRHDEVEPEGREVLLLCHHGRRSFDAMQVLRATGRPELAKARSVAGGIDAWSLGVNADVPRYERGPTGVKARPRG